MTDEKLVYYQEQRERSDAAKGARYKKGHTGKSGCRFPSDYMKRSEIKKLNGEISSIKLNHFYTYDEFKELPDRFKVEYLNHLCEKYKVSLTAIDQEVFEAQGNTRLYQYLAKHNLLDAISRRKYRNPANIKRLAMDVKLARTPGGMVMNDTEPESAVNETPLVKTPEHKGLKRCDVTMNALDISFIQLLVNQFEDRPIRIRLEISEENE